MRPGRYIDIRDRVVAAGFGHDIEWSETVRPPDDAAAFATEAIFTKGIQPDCSAEAGEVFDACN